MIFILLQEPRCIGQQPTTMESNLDNQQPVFNRGNVREVVGYSSDGLSDWQEQILDHKGHLIATVHGATEREVGENAEYIVRAINRNKRLDQD